MTTEQTWLTKEEILSLGFKEIEPTDHFGTGGLEAQTPNYVFYKNDVPDCKISMGYTGDFIVYKSSQCLFGSDGYEEAYKVQGLLPYHWVPNYKGNIPTLDFLKELLQNIR